MGNGDIGHPLSDLVSLAGPYNSKQLGSHVAAGNTSEFGDSGLSEVCRLFNRSSVGILEVARVGSYWGMAWGMRLVIFRAAVILQGIGARYPVRQASGVTAQNYAKGMKPDAYRAWNTIQSLKRLLERTISKL